MNKINYKKIFITLTLFITLGLISGYFSHGPAFPDYGIGDVYTEIFPGIIFGLALSLGYLAFYFIYSKKLSSLKIALPGIILISFIANYIATRLVITGVDGDWGHPYWPGGDYFNAVNTLMGAGVLGAFILAAGLHYSIKIPPWSILILAVLGGALVLLARVIHFSPDLFPHFFNLWVVWQMGIAGAIGVLISMQTEPASIK
jgi:hypothetical protein